MQDLCATGSSPLTPGKLVRFAPGKVHQGLIPAHAGKTSSFSWLLRRSAAHPRSRRENSRVVMMVPFRGGSSPLTRGKRTVAARRVASTGLIPAHAGKTRSGCQRSKHPPAHPRSRGENKAPRYFMPRRAGSSPLTRGKLGRGRLRRRSRGLIPAHAGKTELYTPITEGPEAHPRSRGENHRRHRAAIEAGGSSPLTRGKRGESAARVVLCGLIPAHAGKTDPLFRCECEREAHPRSRGENIAWLIG